MKQEKFLQHLDVYLNNNNNPKAANYIYNQLTSYGKWLLNRYQLREDDRNDVIALSLASAFKNIYYYDRTYSIKTWFGTILKNKLKDFFRREQSSGRAFQKSIDAYYLHESNETDPLPIADQFHCPNERLTNEYLLCILHNEINGLEEGQKKTILRQYFLEQKTNQEIIEENQLKKELVNVTIHRFRENFKKRYQKNKN